MRSGMGRLANDLMQEFVEFMMQEKAFEDSEKTDWKANGKNKRNSDSEEKKNNKKPRNDQVKKKSGEQTHKLGFEESCPFYFGHT